MSLKKFTHLTKGLHYFVFFQEKIKQALKIHLVVSEYRVLLMALCHNVRKVIGILSTHYLSNLLEIVQSVTADRFIVAKQMF